MARFRTEWAAQRWPVAAELIEYFDKAREASEPPVVITQKPKGETWADKLMTLPEGQRALREGFGRELYLWAEQHQGEIPDYLTMQHLKAEEAAFQRSFAAMVEQARKHTHDREYPMGTLALASAVKAGAAAVSYEVGLRNQFLRADERAASDLAPLDAG